MSQNEMTQIKFDNYDVISYFCRKLHIHGGVVVLTNHKISKDFVTRDDIGLLSIEIHCEICAVQSDKHKLLIITLYRSPLGDFNIFLDTFTKLLNIINRNKQNTVIINGDFNINFNNNNNNRTVTFTDIIKTYGLSITIDENTRGNSCLDNFLTNLQSIFQTSLIDTNLSDHLAITLNFPLISAENESITNFNYRPVTDEGIFFLNSLIRNICWDFIDDPNISIETKAEMFITFLSNAVELAFPEKQFKQKNAPNVTWFTEELGQMRDTLHFMQETVKATNSPELREIMQKYRKKYNIAIANAKLKANDTFITRHTNKSKAIWQVVRENTNSQARNLNTDTTISPDDFNNFFAGIAKNIIDQLPNSDYTAEEFLYNNVKTPHAGQQEFNFSEITFIEVRDIIFNLNNKNSKDYYNINTKILKSIANIIIIPLTKLLNLCIKYSVFPIVFKISRVVPIHKKGPTNLLDNYRPISLIPIIAKVFEKALKSRICHFFESNSLYNTNQYGFRNTRSTTMAINKLAEVINIGFETGGYTGALFCDLSKAFDCVSSSILIKKLDFYKFSVTSLNLIQSYLTDRTQVVETGNGRSQMRTLEFGVPQGSVLGPVLFLIYVNDLVYADPRTDFILFADDTTAVNRNENFDELQLSLEETQTRVTAWFLANRLSLNATKTETMFFSLSNGEVNGNPESVKFLGVQIDPKLSWNSHTDKLCNNLTSCIYAIRNLSLIVSRQVLLITYHALFQSKISYAIHAWGHAPSMKRVFGLQRKAVRIINKLGYRDDCTQAYFELKILTVPSIYILQCLMFVKENLQNYITHEEIHSHDTRHKANICIDYHRINKTRSGISFFGPKLFNLLPPSVKLLPTKNFKNLTKKYLLSKCFYSIEEFYSNDFTDMENLVL